MSKRFTFKKTINTGLWAINNLGYIDIKYNKKIVGSINYTNYEIILTVMKTPEITDSNTNCQHKNIILKYKPVSVQDAKRLVK